MIRIFELFTVTVSVSNSQVLLSTFYEPDTFLVLSLLFSMTLYITGLFVLGHMSRESCLEFEPLTLIPKLAFFLNLNP